MSQSINCSPAQEAACRNSDFRACTQQRCDCWHECGMPDPSTFPAILQTTADLRAVRGVLPSTYSVWATSSLVIRCQSATGLLQDGDADDEERWGYTMAAFRQHFGERFIGVQHVVCFGHQDFTICLQGAFPPRPFMGPLPIDSKPIG